MSEQIYPSHGRPERPLVWLHGEVRTPPMTSRARVRIGVLLRRLQMGESLGMPHSRPLPSIGPRCHELRVPDGRVSWRVIYRIDATTVVVLDIFKKQTTETPQAVLDACRERLRRYESTAGEEGGRS
jgi:phage-related protein